MGLINCPDCGREVSDRAVACVSCGAPIAVPGAQAAPPPVDICEVAARPIHDVFQSNWAVEARAMTPEGVRIVGVRKYRSRDQWSKSQGPSFQAKEPGFQVALRELTSDLLQQGWEPMAGGGVSDMGLPRFQRRRGLERERLMEGPGAGGFVITRVTQRFGSTMTLTVKLDGVDAAKLGPGATIRLDMPAGRHRIQLANQLMHSDIFSVDAHEGLYPDLLCGMTPGTMLIGKWMIRAADGGVLSQADKGKPWSA